MIYIANGPTDSDVHVCKSTLFYFFAGGDCVTHTHTHTHTHIHTIGQEMEDRGRADATKFTTNRCRTMRTASTTNDGMTIILLF